MHLEGKLDFETYERKRNTLTKQLEEKKAEVQALEDIGNSKLDLENRISLMHKKLEDADIINEFDRQVFESIIDYVIVGGYDDIGDADPSMITFVYRTGFRDRKNGLEFKPPRRNASKKKKKSRGIDLASGWHVDGSDSFLKDSSFLTSLSADSKSVLPSTITPDEL